MSSNKEEEFHEFLSALSDDICRDLWGIDPADWPGGEHIPVEVTYVHPDGVTDWLAKLPTLAQMFEEAKAADDIDFEHEPELN